MRVIRLRRAATLAVGLTLGLGLAGCGSAAPSGSPSSSSSSPSSTTPPSVTLTGVPKPGVENGCLLLDAYVLIGGDRALLASGATVTVTGHTQDDLASYCQQGTLLVVDTVTPAG